MGEELFTIGDFFQIAFFDHRAIFEGCRYPWQALEKLEAYLFSQLRSAGSPKSQKDVYFENPDQIFIGEGTVVEPGAYIRGPCIIGRDCQIRHGAYIRGNVLVGDRCVIGHTTEVKHSILLNHAKAAHFAFVGDSILGNDVNLGAGVKCANLRLDGAPVVVRYMKESIATGLRKFGAIVGDGCQIGCNVVMNPGTLLGKNAKSYPSLNIGGVIAEGAVVR